MIMLHGKIDGNLVLGINIIPNLIIAMMPNVPKKHNKLYLDTLRELMEEFEHRTFDGFGNLDFIGYVRSNPSSSPIFMNLLVAKKYMSRVLQVSITIRT